MGPNRLEVDIYQIAPDDSFRENRADGTGWEWCWADWRREWMDATPNRHAYRCLPLTIANQTGWWIKNPVGFTATWQGSPAPGSVDFQFDSDGTFWSSWVSNHFGEGIVTWNTPFLFRTRPEGSRLLICGPINSFKADAQPLTAIIESDWMTMSFTMNWKIVRPGRPVRFEAGEPLFQAVPLSGDLWNDLEECQVRYRKLEDDPEVAHTYLEWSQSRQQFHKVKALGEGTPGEWQKDYFKGGESASGRHRTKLKPPQVHRDGSTSTPDGPARAAREARRTKVEPTPPKPGPAAAPTPGVNDEGRRWIAENLLIGSPPEGLVDAMAAAGIAREEASSEVELALRSPYLRGADLIRNRLRKREWLLGTYRKLHRLDQSSGEVPRRHRISRDVFYGAHYVTGRPVIITGMMDDWPAMRDWALDSLAARFGDREVEVRFAGEEAARKVRFAEFIGLVRGSGATKDVSLTAGPKGGNRPALAELWSDVVQVPEYLDGRDPMSGTFWIGPAGPITPVLHELANTFTAQVIGTRKVKLAPSWDLPLMRNHRHVYSSIEGRDLPSNPRPGPGEPQVVECELHSGEILFVPVGCMHFVEGLDVTASMTFTNFLLDNDFHGTYSTYNAV